MVKDVCADCNNNRISYIDSYAKEFIGKYFLVKYKKDDTLSVEYDYAMIQKMCLKFAFNDLRARKKDVSFFDDEVKEFLLNEEKSSPLGNITILAGLAVNTSPAPDYMFGNMKLRWGDSPLLLANSIVTNIDYNTGHISLREEMEKQEFENYALSYVFRFNSLQLFTFMVVDDTLNHRDCSSKTDAGEAADTDVYKNCANCDRIHSLPPPLVKKIIVVISCKVRFSRCLTAKRLAITNLL